MKIFYAKQKFLKKIPDFSGINFSTQKNPVFTKDNFRHNEPRSYRTVHGQTGLGQRSMDHGFVKDRNPTSPLLDRSDRGPMNRGPTLIKIQ